MAGPPRCLAIRELQEGQPSLTSRVRPMQLFEFHGDLFEFRGTVLDALAARGFVWMSDFGSVDLSHDTYGLEVTGIQEEEQVTQIHQLQQKLFPNWRFRRQYYEDRNIGEVGLKVIISRERENSAATGDREAVPPVRV